MWTHGDSERGDGDLKAREDDASHAGPERLRFDVWLLALEPPETLLRIQAAQPTDILDAAVPRRGRRRFSRRDGPRSTRTVHAPGAAQTEAEPAAPRDSVA